MLPAFAYRLFDPVRGYEQEDGYRERITEDLQRSRALMTRELGQAPRAIAWPYGRYTRLSTEAAAAVGFRFGLTFDPEPADARRPMTIPRFSLSSGSLLPAIVENLRVNGTRPRIQRLVGLRVSSLRGTRPNGASAGRGYRACAHDGGDCGRGMEGVEGLMGASPRFLTTHLPVRGMCTRFAWQFQTRAGVRVTAGFQSSPLARPPAAMGDMALLPRLGASPRWTGFCLGHADDYRGRRRGRRARWDTRQRRNAIDVATISPKARLAFACFRAVENRLPGLLLVVMTNEIDPRGPAVAADLTLVRTTATPRDAERLASRMEAAGWLRGESSLRAGSGSRARAPRGGPPRDHAPPAPGGGRRLGRRRPDCRSPRAAIAPAGPPASSR
jgi:hypothetical protein